MASTREQMVSAMCDVMELHGYDGAGLNQVVEESGAPKGSLYHYFPDGKDGLAPAASKRAGRLVAGRIEQGIRVDERGKPNRGKPNAGDIAAARTDGHVVIEMTLNR